jgi:hypothetical protein
VCVVVYVSRLLDRKKRDSSFIFFVSVALYHHRAQALVRECLPIIFLSTSSSYCGAFFLFSSFFFFYESAWVTSTFFLHKKKSSIRREKEKEKKFRLWPLFGVTCLVTCFADEPDDAGSR